MPTDLHETDCQIVCPPYGIRVLKSWILLISQIVNLTPRSAELSGVWLGASQTIDGEWRWSDGRIVPPSWIADATQSSKSKNLGLVLPIKDAGEEPTLLIRGWDDSESAVFCEDTTSGKYIKMKIAILLISIK